MDAGSAYGRIFPCHSPSAQVATSSLHTFTADIASKLGFDTTFKPQVVRSDQGSAFIARHFQEFLNDRQIMQSLASTYTPKQNSHIERLWGIIFGTARVLLASSNLPPTFHPCPHGNNSTRDKPQKNISYRRCLFRYVKCEL